MIMNFLLYINKSMKKEEEDKKAVENKIEEEVKKMKDEEILEDE